MLSEYELQKRGLKDPQGYRGGWKLNWKRLQWSGLLSAFFGAILQRYWIEDKEPWSFLNCLWSVNTCRMETDV